MDQLHIDEFEMDFENTFVPVHLISELTSKCNLRCTYCPKGDLNKNVWNNMIGRDSNLEGKALDKYLKAVKELDFFDIQLSGIGEFSVRDDWVELGKKILTNSKSELSIISNFGRLFNNEELDFLISMPHITVSVDTPDPLLLKKVRKAVDLKIITSNFINLNARCFEKNVPKPFVKINATMFCENLTHIYNLACYSKSVGIDYLQIARGNFSDQNEFPTPIEKGKTSSIDATQALEQIEKSKLFLNTFGIEFNIFGDLEQAIRDIAQNG